MNVVPLRRNQPTPPPMRAGRCWLWFHDWTKWAIKPHTGDYHQWRQCLRCGVTQTKLT